MLSRRVFVETFEKQNLKKDFVERQPFKPNLRGERGIEGLNREHREKWNIILTD